MPIVVSCELWMQVASNFAANIDFIGVYYSTIVIEFGTFGEISFDNV
jgi:hypothetical protein